MRIIIISFAYYILSKKKIQVHFTCILVPDIVLYSIDFSYSILRFTFIINYLLGIFLITTIFKSQL